MKIAALQLSTLPLSNSKLDLYLNSCSKNAVRVVVLGEYVLNSFFKELVTMPKSMIKEQSKHKIEALSEYAFSYNLVIVAPIVVVEGDKIYKRIGRFTPAGVEFQDQEFLISYPHWNEESFFDNEPHHKVKPMVFTLGGFRFGVINGFEIHFDVMWQEMVRQNVHVVLLPSVSTFGSNQRWNEILKTRAFINGLYILRVNRIGAYHNEESLWKFYGETYLVNPDGFIENSLGAQEEMLLASVLKKEVQEARKVWKFQDQLHKRGLL